jgi:signal transduction histidine kinase
MLNLHFWGRIGTFPSVSIDRLCPEGDRCKAERHLRQSLYQKIVLLGLTRPEDQYESPFAMPSPWGEMMPAVEIQANLLASLLTQTYYHTLPKDAIFALLSLGTLALSGAIAWRFFGSRRTHILSSSAIALWFGGYLGLAMLSFGQGWLLPVVYPVLLWGLTGIALSVNLVSWRRHQWLAAQLQELDQLKSVERQASVFHAQKLLERVATDVHDGPLQELKLVMDRLEELQCNSRLPEINPIIDQIERIGHSLREQLNDTCQIANKLEITPQLRAGLDIGIRYCIHALIRSGELQLRVVDNLKPIQEPSINSDWIAAREDILRFAKEALANIIHHAQPPHGTATQVIATLNQQRSRCILSLENDSFQPLDHLLSKNQPNRGGYGTKVMETIASGLPDGCWHREWLPEGGMKVSLEWNLFAFTVTESPTEYPLVSHER